MLPVNRREGTNSSLALDTLRYSLESGSVIATFESASVPATQKDAWKSIRSLLDKGHVVRKAIDEYSKERGGGGVSTAYSSVMDGVVTWLASLDESDLATLGGQLQMTKDPASNTKEFVRYLLRPRSSDDDSRDQADFYYLARNNSRSFWFEPGPEWLVVVTGLLGSRPGGQCTLGMLVDDLRKLGIRVDRWILVRMLEEAGLSTDSPDADSALLIRSGF